MYVCSLSYRLVVCTRYTASHVGTLTLCQVSVHYKTRCEIQKDTALSKSVKSTAYTNRHVLYQNSFGYREHLATSVDS